MNKMWRQRLHLEPPIGWLNDPNGLCWFNQKYHVYFQYAPEDVFGSVKKCWGHYESADMLNWVFTGTVLFPDTPDDMSGAYSGCAVVDRDVLNIFYTGNVKHPGTYDYVTSGRDANVIRVTTTDGRHMSPKQVLLRNSDYPAFCSRHVRDPKVWREDDAWYMILGARTLDSKGCVLIYQSQDLQNWEYKTCIAVPDFGYMWECPDCFALDEAGYISVSPQGLEHEETRYQNRFSSGYFQYDGELKNFTEWDYGFDFYAPQTFEAPDGRRILYGWMGMPDAYGNLTVGQGWQHCLTLPRELSQAENGMIIQKPIRELDSLRCYSTEPEDNVETGVTLPFDLVGKPKSGTFQIRMDSLTMNYDGEVFSLAFDQNAGLGRDVRRVKIKGCGDIRVIADTSSIEIYLDGGRYVMSTRFYPKSEMVRLKLNGISAVRYALKGMKMEIKGE